MIIGITGRIAAGKETLTRFLIDQGFDYLETSNILKEKLHEQGIAITRKNMQDCGDKLRKEHGTGILMKIFLDKIDLNKDYMIDSLRNDGEVKELRKLSEKGIKVFIIGINASQKTRFERIISRAKPSDPKTWEEFLEVDNRDYFDSNNPLGQQVDKCMKLADYRIVNDGNLEESKNEIKEVWEKIKDKTHKNI